MKPNWKTFLVDAGAEFEDDRIVHYGNPERERRMVMTGNVFCDLSHLGLISAYGEDALTFLQGQFTNDLSMVDETRSQLSAYCDPKGRVLASFRLFKRGDTYYMALPRQNLEPVLQRLRKYVLRADVTLEDASDAFVRVGMSGPSMDVELGHAVSPIPSEIDQVTTLEDVSVLRIPGLHHRFQAFGELETMKKVWDRLNVRCAPIGPAPYKLLDVLGGVPTVYPETAERFLPQMLNLDALSGVSFKKGCYPGQEIVARVKHLGGLKRRMIRAHVRGTKQPKIADSVYLAGQDQAVGQVIDSQPHPDGGHEILAVLQIDLANRSDLVTGSPNGLPIVVGNLPYSAE
ncbi:MAG: folate-binding protein [Pseudomonadota bacterium]|nr:folate-binding protein [Pseudomonadota bacterium]